MILDKIENLVKYASINPLFQKVVEYLNTTDVASQPEGKVLIDGTDLFVNYNVAKGKSIDEARIETHDKMIDLQMPLSGPETFGFSPRADLPEAAYNAEKDITFYEGRAEKYITVQPGEFVIFFPQDGHAPCISDAEKIVKVIFKIKA